MSRFNFSNHGKDLYLSDYEQCGSGLPNNVSINDMGLGFTYGGVGFRQLSLSHQSNGRFNVSIINGQHSSRPACSGCTVWAAATASTPTAHRRRSTACRCPTPSSTATPRR